MPLSQPTDNLTMPEVHDRVLDILLQWQAETDDQNRFFYLKRRRDERFEKGHWFPGNEDFLLVSFWSGSDNDNKSSNAYLEIRPAKGCTAYLTAKDSEVKRTTFQQWIGETGDSRPLVGYRKKGRQKGQWYKPLSHFSGDFETCLRAYLRDDKRVIDGLIRESPEPIGEDYEAPFTFIDEQAFAKSFSLVQQQRAQLMQRRALEAGTQQAISGGSTIRLAQLVVRTFHDLKGLKLLDLPPGARWIFLTGENAAGKTVFLRALALGLSNRRIYDKYKGEGTDLSAAIWLNEHPYVITPTTSEAGSLPMLDGLNGYLVAYGASRLAALRPEAQNQDSERETPIDSLFEPTGVPLKSFDFAFAQADKNDHAKRDFLRKAIKAATANRISNITVEPMNGVDSVRYQEVFGDEATTSHGATDGVAPTVKKTTSEVLKPPVPFTILASGLRGIINLVGDIYIRLTGAQDVKDPADLVGIVIIDELENHLHPKLQKALPQALSAVFPKVQFIASTHSPIPFLGAPKETAFILVSRDAHHHITAEHLTLSVDFTTLLPNTLFSSPLFGFDALTPTEHTPGQPVRTETSFEQVQRNDEIQKDLAGYLTEEKTKEILALFQNAREAD